MKPRSIIALASVAAFVGAACAAFSGSDNNTPIDSTDASSSGPDAVGMGAVDGTSPVADAGSVVEAGGGAVDSGGAFCTGAEHWLCDDFDRAGAINDLAPWAAPGIGVDASLEMVPPPLPAPPSPPNALVSSAPGNVAAVAYAHHGAPSAGFRCDFSMRIRQRGQEQALLFVLSLESGGPYYRLQLSGSPDEVDEYGVSPEAGALPVHTLDSLVIKDNVWARYSLQAKLGAGGFAKVLVNGVDTGALSAYLASGIPTPTATNLQLGVAVYSGPGGWIVDYDNVSCDPLP